MGAAELLKLVVDADVHGAVSGLKKVGDTTTKELGKSQKTIDKWGKGFSKAGVGMVAFGATALVGLGHMAKRSEEANLSTVKLQNSLAANPRLAGTSAKSFIDLAQAIQGKTAADGDDIVAGMAVLAQGKLQAAQIKQLTPLVVDLARKKGIDEVTAFTLASKAVQGNAGALKRAGIAVDETKFKTDAYGATVDALKTSVGGFAQSEGKTFEGSLQRAKNQLGDLEEGVGAGAVDAFTSLLGVVGKASDALNKISPGAQGAIGKIAAIGAVGLVAVGGVSTLVGKVIEARAAFSTLADSLATLPAKFSSLIPSVTATQASMEGATAATVGFEGSLSSILGPAAAVAAGLVALRSVAQSMKHGMGDEDIDRMAKSLENLGKTGEVSGAQLQSTLKTLTSNPGGFDPVGKMSQSIDDLDKALAKLAATDPGAASKAFDQIIDRLSDKTGISKKALAASGAFDDYKRAVKDAGSASGEAATGIKGSGDALDAQKTSAEKATQALQDYHDKMQTLFDPLFGLQDAFAQNAKAQSDVTAKQLELIAAENAYQDAIKKHGPTSKEAKSASLDLMGAQQALTAANQDATRSAFGVDGAIADMRAEIQKNPAALDQAKKKLQEWVGQGLITQGQAAQTGREFDALAGKVRAVPAAKAIAVSTSGTAAAQVNIQKVKDALANTPGFKSITIDLHVTGAAAVQRAESKLLGPGHAGGGPVNKGVAYPVGEQGPELFVPSVNGMIIPHHRIASSSMSATGGYVDNRVYNINVHGGDPKAVVEALKRYQRHNGAVPIAVTGQGV